MQIPELAQLDFSKLKSELGKDKDGISASHFFGLLFIDPAGKFGRALHFYISILTK